MKIKSLGLLISILSIAFLFTGCGEPVMEMTAEEMTARSLSRLTYEHEHDTAAAWTENQIIYYTRNEDRQREAPQKAYAYAEAAFATGSGKHLYFVPGRRPAEGLTLEEAEKEAADNGEAPTTDKCGVREFVESLSSLNPLPPVVIVDYLQIMRPEPGTERLTEREQINRNIEGLLRLKTVLQCPVIAVSSYNRNSYNKSENTNAAFKGSGEIEYSADALIFLSVITEAKDTKPGNGGKWGNGSEDTAQFYNAMGEETRKIKYQVTKNRGAKYWQEVNLDYIPRFNLFQESIDETIKDKAQERKAHRKEPF